MRSYLVLTENGPLLVLTSMANITDEILLDSLYSKGIDKFIAYEVPQERVRSIYGVPYEVIAEDLSHTEDLRVLDFNGHHIFSRFSFSELGEPIMCGD